MTLSNKTYDFLKWLLIKVVPALILLIEGLGLLYGWDTKLVIGTISLIATFLGTILGISSTNYNKKNTKKVK